MLHAIFKIVLMQRYSIPIHNIILKRIASNHQSIDFSIGRMTKNTERKETKITIFYLSK